MEPGMSLRIKRIAVSLSRFMISQKGEQQGCENARLISPFAKPFNDNLGTPMNMMHFIA
jgi:hypothetical protein